MTRIAAIVPMKGHSQRVPRKNLRPLCGRPLYHWIVQSLIESERVTEVVIETDSDEIAADARAHFDATILRRPAELVGDDVPMNSLIAFHLAQIDADLFLQTHATNPLLTPATINAAIGACLAARDEHDSLFTVTRLQTRLYFADGRPVNHDPAVLLPTQSLPPIYEENSNAYVFTRESFGARGRRIGERPLLFPMDKLEAVDIDEPADFALAELLMSSRLAGQKGAR